MQTAVNHNMGVLLHDHRRRQMWAWVIATVAISVLFTGWIMRLGYIQRHETPLPQPIDFSTRTGAMNGKSLGAAKTYNGVGFVTHEQAAAPKPTSQP